ncbi:glycosyltransferase family 2 protein [Paenibacillus wynnii]|uniref:Glycosyl transferase family 2 n=1 Tax=Paenibacillus wynnii TaxID=268407 RepID=A0A098MD42_9BACL|nr:glycosyltransferase family 2 protein [Paenibacillus wynnii]KGE20490.1 glycosyl transferase family 2 [Paenibacillus wynnii]
MNIQVLLSTFNGQRYIVDQIESILSQTYKNVKLLIRDDGSNDNTVKYIERYLDKYPEKICLIRGSNIGVIESFLQLLRNADSNSSYYAFCDQDDVWLDHKLESAIKKIREADEGKPILVFSPTYLTDSNLQKIKIWPGKLAKPASFYNALIENIAVGTTITINNLARELLISKQPTMNKLIMHDWWSYLCISAFGEVIYDEKPSVFYRQHQNNLIGGNKTLVEVVFRKLKSYKTNKGSRLLHYQALEFLKCYGFELEEEKKRQLNLFVGPRKTYISRIHYLRRSELYRQTFQENLLFKILIIIGYI